LVRRQIDETADALYTLYGLDVLRSSYRNFASICALCGMKSFQTDCLLGSNQSASDSVNMLLRGKNLWKWEEAEAVSHNVLFESERA